MTDRHKENGQSEKRRTLPERGYFISFEGGEGAGKSTQINRLAEYLRQAGLEVVVTREPGGTAGAEAIRHVLLNAGAKDYGPVLEAVLFAAARIDHMDALITPALKAGKIVLCDRFIDSTRVYQGMGGKLARSYVSLLERIAVDQTVPDTTFILDLPAEEGMARAHARRKSANRIDRFEKAAISIQESRRQAFLKIARAEPQRCHVIDAARPLDIIAAEIASICERKIHRRDG